MGRVRDGWLLARELCLHYGDYNEIKPHHFVVDKQGRLLFDKARVKQEGGRDIRQVSIVSDRALSIWYRYGQKIPLKGQGQYFNRVLKEIGAMAELNQSLNFSHARDSGIFNLVASGCPEFVIKLAAGWTSTKQLVRYVNHDRRLLEAYQHPPFFNTHTEDKPGGYRSLTHIDQRILPISIDAPKIATTSDLQDCDDIEQL